MDQRAVAAGNSGAADVRRRRPAANRRARQQRDVGEQRRQLHQPRRLRVAQGLDGAGDARDERLVGLAAANRVHEGGGRDPGEVAGAVQFVGVLVVLAGGHVDDTVERGGGGVGGAAGRRHPAAEEAMGLLEPWAERQVATPFAAGGRGRRPGREAAVRARVAAVHEQGQHGPLRKHGVNLGQVVVEQQRPGIDVDWHERLVEAVEVVAVDVSHLRAVPGVLERQDVAGRRRGHQAGQRAENAGPRRLLVEQRRHREAE